MSRSRAEKAASPATYPCAPVGLNREQSAAHIGVSEPFFDRLVEQGVMPQPRSLGTRLIWDVEELDYYFRRIPKRDGLKGQARPAQIGEGRDPYAVRL